MLTPQNLRPYQLRNTRFGIENDISALFSDPGLGKTVSALSVVKAWMHKSLINKPVLIVAPLRVVYNVWRQESIKWSHTKGLRFSLVHGNVNRRKAALAYPADVYLINPEGLVWLINLMFEAAKGTTIIQKVQNMAPVWPFDALIIDESTKFKKHDTQRFKALRKVLGLFKKRMILTGTPTPNSLLELWAQIFILDGGERLGKNYSIYKERFFIQDDYLAYTYKLRPGAEAEIAALTSDIVLRMEAKDWLDLPDVITQEVEVSLPANVAKLYAQFEKEMFVELERGDVEAVNAATLSQKCHQVANGAVYSMDRTTGERDWEVLHDEKIEAVNDLMEEIGSPVLIVYNFKHDLARLRKVFPDAPNIGSGTKELGPILDEWKAGKHKCILIHPQSAAHGVDGLQHGCRHIIFFSLIWSAENYQQVIERIGPARRQGLKEPTVIHLIIAKNTVDVAIRIANQEKAATQAGFQSALKKYRQMKEGE